MKKSTLYRLIEDNLWGELYDIAYAIAEDFADDADIEESDFIDNLLYEIDNHFIYYADAWEYLQDNGITDFSEAIDEFNATNVCSIAGYYAYQEIVNSISPEWDSYESDEKAIEDDWEYHEDESTEVK